MRKLVCIVMGLMLAPLVARADEGTLSVSPAVVMLRGVAGQSTTQTMTIMNSSTQPFSFDLKAKDIVVRDGKRVFVEAGQLPGSIANTAVFSRKSVTVLPGERMSVDVTVTIPPNAASRGVVALFQGTTKVQQGGVQVTASLGTLLTFALTDEVIANASPVSVKPPTATSNLTVAQQLANDGKEPLFAKGMLAIVNSSGVLVAKEALPGRRLMPGEKTDIRAEYGGDLAPGVYRALVTYDLQNNNPLTSSAEFTVQ